MIGLSITLANDRDLVASQKEDNTTNFLNVVCFRVSVIKQFILFFQSYLHLRALFCTLLQIHLLHALVIYST